MLEFRESRDIVSECDALSLTDSRALYGSENALPLLVVETTQFRSVIALQGAQLLSHVTAAGDCLWLSEDCRFEAGKPIRGGVPLCLPWFGPHPSGEGFPKHGLARLQEWRLEMAHSEGREIILRFCCELKQGGGVASDLVARLEMRLADSVTMVLQMVNVGRSAMPLSFAFHSYFAVDDVRRAEVDNLQSREYLDNTDGLSVKLQRGRLGFNGEVDRVFQGVVGGQRLLAGSALRVTGQACPTVIVWNPGPELGAEMDDVGDGWKKFVCVERGAAFGDALLLQPGSSYVSRMSIIRDD